MRYRLALSMVCVCALACSDGGQSSDDGSLLDGGPHRPDASEPDASDDDASTPELTIVVEVVLDGEAVVGCGAGFSAADAEDDPRAAIKNAPQHCEGNTSRYDCECDGEAHVAWTQDCVAALFQACGARAEAPDGSGARATFAAECEAPYPPLAGHCERNAEGTHDCSCATEPSGETDPVRIAARGEASPVSCEQALFDACAKPCSDDFGECTPSDDGTIGEYACECSTNGLARVVGSFSCDEALFIGCHPGNTDAYSCTGYGGYCEVIDPAEGTQMRCACADGELRDAELVPYSVEPRLRLCREALEETCGLGSPPEGAQCLDEGNGYLARCTRAPDPDAELVCECYLAAIDDGNARVGTVVGHDCDATTLPVFCPQIAGLAASDLERTCEHYEACDSRITGFTRERCMENASDACIACTVAALDAAESDADGCPLERLPCYEPCKSIVPKEVGVAICETNALALGPLTDEGRCLCDRCYPAFGDCLADSGCTEILQCATEQACMGPACESDPVCGPIIMSYYGTRSLGLILNVSACEERDACRAMP